MSSKNILTSINETSSKIGALKSELRWYHSQLSTELDKILEILEKPQIRGDEITYLEEDCESYEFDAGPELLIQTSYSLRCCNMNGEHRIPMSIMNADDPLEAAREFMGKKAKAEEAEAARQESDRRKAIIEEYHRIQGEQA
jgi:hypothetical protein